MQKTSNPWAQALTAQKAKLDLHPDVLHAVLAMNPAMRRGRTTGEVTADLQEQALAARHPAKRGFAEGKARSAFSTLLTELGQQLTGEGAKFAARRAQLAREEAAMRLDLVNRIVEFLARLQPGGVSETSRTVMREHADLFRQLGVEPSHVGQRVREQSDAVASPS